MANVLSFRRGAKVRHVETHYNMWGNPISTTNNVVTILSRPRDKHGRFCKPDAWCAYVDVRNEDGEEYGVYCEDCEPYNTIWDLTHDELCALRGQVVLGSCFLRDYDNKFGIDPNQVYTFCDGYGEEIGWSDEDDTPEAFADYCEGVERWEDAA